MKKRVPKNYCIGDANVFADNTITPSAKALYGLICCYSDEYGLCHPGINRLAWEMGVDSRTVQRWMAELNELGIICRDDKKGVNIKTKICDAVRVTWKAYDKFVDSMVVKLKNKKHA